MSLCRFEHNLCSNYAQEIVCYLSYHDFFTGLYNRAYFEEAKLRLDTPRQLPISAFGDLTVNKQIDI